MVEEKAVDGDDGEQVVFDEVVIPDDFCTAIIAHEEFFLAGDGDMIPDEVVAKKGFRPDEVVAEEMLEDQTRSIKRGRLMADKKTKDYAQ